jgi:transcriptional regulator with XRE-family HTH domain
MERRRRTTVEVLGTREAHTIAGALGREVRLTLKRRHQTHAELGERVGISRARVSELARGEGASAPLAVWIRLGLAIDRPLAVSFSRSLDTHGPRDAGHLAAQELVLRLVRQAGRKADFESPTRPADPSRSIDVAIRDDRARTIIVVEIWNRLDDLGAAARASSRKVSEAERLTVAAARDGKAYRVTLCWLLVDTSANRRLVGRYPEIMRSRFPGSSVAWARCIVEGAPPPHEPGCAWIDPRSDRVMPLRLRGAVRGGA